MSEWWWGIPPAVAPMPCAARHHARWERGALEVPDLDAEAEGVLAALGGAACRCLEAAQAWEAHAGDLRMLVLGARTTSDAAQLTPMVIRDAEDERLPSLDAWERHRRRLVTSTIGPRLEDAPPLPADTGADTVAGAWRHRLGGLLLLALPNVLQRRLAATVGHALERRWDALSGADRAVVTAAITGRAAPSLTASLVAGGIVGTDLPPVIDLRVAAPGTAAAIEVEATASGLRLDVTLGLDWLRAVWGREVALVDERFVTSVTEVSPARVSKGLGVRWVRSGTGGNSRVEAVVEEWETGEPPLGDTITWE